jgi:flagellar hook-basal body complex protein FliE
MAEPIGNNIRILPGFADPIDSKPKAKVEPEVTQEAAFTDLFANMINSVNDIQKESGQIQEAFLSGEPVELHQVMIKAEEAGLATNLLLEIRNRLVNGFKELLRMPV